MLAKKDIKKFWKYVENTFEKDEIESALDAFEFERKYLKDEELDKLPPEEIQKLYGYLVYIVMNELGDGDFYTMYDVLSENMGLSQEDISYLLDY